MARYARGLNCNALLSPLHGSYGESAHDGSMSRSVDGLAFTLIKGFLLGVN